MASDEEKGELLKDLLAFANSWRRSDAFILIGIEEISGGPPVVRGITEHVDDARLQQFVNSKTQRPLTFSYRAVEFEGVQLGVLHVPLQDRPVYIKRDFGRLKANTVYLRRGSSTGIADPDEIARMGAATSQASERPTLEFGLADPNSHEWIGTAFRASATFLEVTPSTPFPTITSYQGEPIERRYPEMLLQFVQVREACRPLALAVRNSSAFPADAVYVEIEIPSSAALLVFDESTLPSRPSMSLVGNFRMAGREPDPDITVKNLGTRWMISAEIGKVRPGATVVSRSLLYIGAAETQQLSTEAVVYSQNLEPVRVPLVLEFVTDRRPMQGSDWRQFADR